MTKILTLALLGFFAVTPANADDWSDCAQTADRDLSIRACSSIITEGRETSENLAFADSHRGFAYAGDDDHDWHSRQQRG